MKFAKYGYDVLIVSLLIALGLIVGGAFISIVWLQAIVIALGVLFALFTLNFFRDPDRPLPDEARSERVVLSPADGKIVLIHNIHDTEYHNGPATLIAIFLSPLDVHVNRNPISGTVDYFKYIEGKFVPAFQDKASDLNERTHIGIQGTHVKLLMKQIAGAVARRIVCPLSVGESVTIGERFGMIKYGSRTDVIVPQDMIVHVKLGDRVVGGETILCRMPENR